MTLAGLLQGAFNVESIDVEAPAVDFERLASGDVNWLFAPTQGILRSEVLSRVKLDKIALSGGTVSFTDERRAVALHRRIAGSPCRGGADGHHLWRLRAGKLRQEPL